MNRIKRNTQSHPVAVFVMGACGVVDGLIQVLSLGFLTSDYRASWIFSEKVDDLDVAWKNRRR